VPLFSRAASHPTSAPIASKDVLEYLNHSIDWYHRIEAVDPTLTHSQELLLRGNVRDNAKQVVKLGLQFARAEAAMLDTAAASSAATSTTTKASVNGGANLAQLAAKATARVQQLQAQIAQVEANMPSSPATSQPALSQQRDRLNAQLNLAKAQQEVLTQYASFVSAAQSGDSTTLSAKIDALERSVPEVAADQSSATTVSNDNNASESSESGNLLSIFRELFAMNSGMSELSSVASETQRLAEENETFRGPIRTQIVDAIRQANQLAASTQPADGSSQASDQRAQLDALTARFKQLSAAGVPLGEQRVMLDSAKQNLANWRSTLGRQSKRLLRELLMRVAILGAIIFVIIIGAAWSKRATMRYVHDPRRRRQLLVVRRIVVAAIVSFVIIISVVSEFGSIATFAGLITAGIAVALQTVILSGVAYFFFIGRFGVRVGDRVTISNITGDVIEIGVFRLYLMELGGKPDLHPTGRIVVFSNSVLFQPQAFYKQLPGADYTWHEITFTLSPDTDYRVAQSRLFAAVESVVNQYSDSLRAQHESATSHLQIQLDPPKTQARLRFVDAGLELVIRYPVELKKAAEIDDQVTRKLLETVNEEPKLKLVSTSTPSLQPAA
jgi:small-conductance mechanosensitive channel